MKKSVFALITGVILIPSTLLFGDPTPAPTGGPAAKRALTPPCEQTRGDTRCLVFKDKVADGLESSYMIARNNEIDVTSATLGAVNADDPRISGEVYVTWKSDPACVTPIYFAISGTGTIHLEFDPPIQVRYGDTVTFAPSIAGGESAQWTLVLNGEVPRCKPVD